MQDGTAANSQTACCRAASALRSLPLPAVRVGLPSKSRDPSSSCTGPDWCGRYGRARCVPERAGNQGHSRSVAVALVPVVTWAHADHGPVRNDLLSSRSRVRIALGAPTQNPSSEPLSAVTLTIFMMPFWHAVPAACPIASRPWGSLPRPRYAASRPRRSC
jgi:hypothetical protein